MSALLGASALLSFLWAIGFLFFKELVLGIPIDPTIEMLANGAGVANLVFAFVFWRGARAPERERGAVYTALLILGLRGASGTYAVLYLVEGRAAVASLFEMITSIGFFVGVLNSLPSIFGNEDRRTAVDRGPGA